MKLTGKLGPLAERDFARFFSANLISTAGSAASVVALTFAILDSSGPTALGIVLLARELPLVTFVLVGGVFADRWSRRWVMSISAFASGFSQFCAALLLLQDKPSILGLIVLAVLNGSVNAFRNPATGGILPELVRKEHLQPANALLGLNRQVTGIAGVALGSLLINFVGSASALAFDSLTFVISGFFYLSLPKHLTRTKSSNTPIEDFKEGWNEVRTRRWILVMITSFGLFQIAYFPALMVLCADITRKHLGGPSAWALILTSELVGGILGSLLSLKIYFKRPLVAANLVIAPTILQLFGFALSWPLFVLMIFAATASIGFAVGNTVWTSTLQKLIPNESLSRVSSFDWLGSIALNPLGYALIGPISSLLGERETVAWSAGFLSIGILLPLLSRSTRSIELARDSRVEQ